MNQQIEGLFLSSTAYSDNSAIVQLYTEQYGRHSFIFKRLKNKNNPYVFQPFHFIEFTCNYNNNKNINLGVSPSLISPFYEITSDIRKISVALFLTEVLSLILKEETRSSELYVFLKRSIILFDKEPFHPDFHLVLLMHLFKFLGIQPINNHSRINTVFNLKEAKFIKLQDFNTNVNTISTAFSSLLGMKIDAYQNKKFNASTRNQLLDLILNYLGEHCHFNASKISSHKILKTIFN